MLWTLSGVQPTTLRITVAPKVYNKRHKDVPKDAVYVGRPSKWGNPFEIGKDGTREEVVKKYEQWIIDSGYYRSVVDVRELRGKDLVCWCAPALCHADILLKLANEDENGS